MITVLICVVLWVLLGTLNVLLCSYLDKKYNNSKDAQFVLFIFWVSPAGFLACFCGLIGLIPTSKLLDKIYNIIK